MTSWQGDFFTRRGRVLVLPLAEGTRQLLPGGRRERVEKVKEAATEVKEATAEVAASVGPQVALE